MPGLIGFKWGCNSNRLGDMLSRSSLPENFYKNTGERLINLDSLDCFKYNPYVIQSNEVHSNTLSRVEIRDLWNYQNRWIDTMHCKTMAHEICAKWELEKCHLNRPKLYHFEDIVKFPRSVVINTTGHTHGAITLDIINHTREVYKNYHTIQIGSVTDIDAGADFDRRGISFWESAKIMSEAEIFIGIDSFCYWLSKCFDHIHRKIILTNQSESQLEKFLPRGYPENSFGEWWIENDGSELFNCYDKDIGITKSYLSI